MKFITYDLGTGGVKAALYDEAMQTLAKSFIEYPTSYPAPGWHEQKPSDWWNGVVESTRVLLQKVSVDASEIGCLALSGHSCVAVPLDDSLEPLTDTVPIWSDTRAGEQIRAFFRKVDEKDWYMKTGNGFPAACYALFKLMWLKETSPELFAKIRCVVGSKDYINLRLTGRAATDPSYASSSGAYDLVRHEMCAELLSAAGIPASIWPEILPSHAIVGTITEKAAAEIGLKAGTAVACGGVDNACMAMGAVGAQEGAFYTSLGSSSWIPMNSRTPVLDFETKPYVFAHIEDGMYTSAYSIFAGGSSYHWVRDTLCKDLQGDDAYRKMDELAASSPIGANGVFFNPSLAGGTSQDKSLNVHGAFLNLQLGTTREDLIRAALEGITLNLKTSYDLLARYAEPSDHLLICGGGSKSRFWMQLFADIFGTTTIKTNIDQDAASMGAAAICARATGLWSNYDKLPSLHHPEIVCKPDPETHAAYARLYPIFRHVYDAVADLGDYLSDTLLYK